MQDEGGFALVATLLILLALGVLLSGLVHISAEEAWIARSMEELLRARHAAESSIRSLMAQWGSDEHGGHVIGTIRRLESTARGGGRPISTVTTIERLDDHHFLIRAHAMVPSGVRATAAAVVRTLDPLELWRDLPAALVTAGPIETWGDAALAGFIADPEESADESGCLERSRSIVYGLFGVPELPPLARPPVTRTADLSFGPFDMQALQRAADRVVTGTIDLQPAASTSDCVSPHLSGSGVPPPLGIVTCGAAPPLIFSPAGLRLEGGQGRGILAVRGDLTIAGGTEFHGIVLVEGRLRLTDRARIHGAAIVAGRAAATSIEDEAYIGYAPCVLEQIIEGAALGRRVYDPGDRTWIPGF